MDLFMLDLCSGLKGASAAMRERGWRVVTVDNEPALQPDIVADVRAWSWDGLTPDLVWASPPCIEFARESMPWSRTGRQPDMSIVDACFRIVRECKPRYWIIENVRGAIPFWLAKYGVPRAIYGPFYLWGFFPSLGNFVLEYRRKESYSSGDKRRGGIPFQLSLAVSCTIEQSRTLFETVSDKCDLAKPP